MTDIVQRPNAFPWPPLVFVAAISASFLCHFFYELPWPPSPLQDILFAFGWLFVATGVALLISAIRVLAKAKTTASPTKGAAHLVTTGAFGISRNPIYLANALVMIGIGLISGIAWFVPLAIVATFATQKLAVEHEEHHLDARFGKKYRDYAKKVRRWI